MTLTAILLLLCAAGLHAGWNSLGKHRSPTPSAFLLANTAGMVLLAVPVLALYSPLIPRVSGPVWIALAATAVFQTVYYVGLAGAYARGDLSVAYPLARSSPIIIVTVLSVFMGQGKQIGPGCVAGILLVVGGCFLLPMRRFGDFRLRNYWNACCLLAFVAACGTAGYTLIDDWGLRALRALPERGFGVASAPLVYLFIETALSSVWLGLYVLARRTDRAHLAQALRTQKRQAFLMGAGISCAYGLVLTSFAFVRNVSYAAAFRQVSILIGVAIAAIFMKEPMPPPRWVGAIVIFTGLVLVALG